MTEGTTFHVIEGESPLVVSMPHTGSWIPAELHHRLSATGRMIPDTDWDLDRLYDWLPAHGASVIRATWSRYVIDLNRHPDGLPLYPGGTMNHTALVPASSFDGVPLYHEGKEPTSAEVAQRLQRYWRPWHARLDSLVAAARHRHGRAVLFDCHSIRSVVPRYQASRLPDLNIGTADGTSCAPELRETIAGILGRDRRYSVAVDGLFKGGYITRHYGRPEEGIHAFQLEQSLAIYMQETPTPVIDPDRVRDVKPLLEDMVKAVIDWARA